MGTLYRAKSENFWAAAAVGATNQWIHLDAAATGRVTIVPATVAGTTQAGAIKPIVLQSATINTGVATKNVGVIITDSARGIAAQLSGVTEKDFHYNIPFRGSLIIDNATGADITVAYIRD